MRPYGEPVKETKPNAWGHDRTVTKQAFIIEPSDVGTFRHHYLGYNRRSHRFTEDEVGCSIIVYTDETGWTNWVFGLNWEAEECKVLH